MNTSYSHVLKDFLCYTIEWHDDYEYKLHYSGLWLLQATANLLWT